MSEQAETLKICLDAIWRKANAIRIAKHNQQTKRFAGEMEFLVALAMECNHER